MKMNCRPAMVEITRLLSSADAVSGFANTSRGSSAEYSAWNIAESPTTTELTGSGSRIVVVRCGDNRRLAGRPSTIVLVVCPASVAQTNTINDEATTNCIFIRYPLSPPKRDCEAQTDIA